MESGVKRERESAEPGEIGSVVPKLVRTNRLFGNLISHLGRAKREGEETRQKKEAERQSSEKRQTEVQEQKKTQFPPSRAASKLVNATTQEGLPPERETTSQMMSEVLIKKQIAEAEKQLSDFEAEYSPRSRFLVTEVKPRLLWLPGKHSASTEAELKSRLADFESVFAKKKEQTQEKVAVLEQSLRAINRPEQATIASMAHD